MKKNIKHKGIEDLHNMTLTQIEKEKMFSYLENYANTHPVTVKQKKSLLEWLSFPALSYRYATFGVVALVLLAGGGFAWAAEYALPGEFLYGVKLHVNESLEGAFKVTPEAKAKWQETKVVRRLQEAEVLADKGELTAIARAEIEKEVDKNISAYVTAKAEAEMEKKHNEENKNKDNTQRVERKILKPINTEVDTQTQIVLKKTADVSLENKMTAQLDRIKEKRKKNQNSVKEKQDEIDNLEKQVKEKIEKVRQYDRRKEDVKPRETIKLIGEPIPVVSETKLDLETKTEVKVENKTNIPVKVIELKKENVKGQLLTN